MDLGPFRPDHRPALAPIGLTLPARRSFESDCRLEVRLLPQWADESANCVIAARVAPDSELLEDRLGTVVGGKQKGAKKGRNGVGRKATSPEPSVFFLL
jgi:hypothetical protein